MSHQRLACNRKWHHLQTFGIIRLEVFWALMFCQQWVAVTQGWLMIICMPLTLNFFLFLSQGKALSDCLNITWVVSVLVSLAAWPSPDSPFPSQECVCHIFLSATDPVLPFLPWRSRSNGEHNTRLQPFKLGQKSVTIKCVPYVSSSSKVGLQILFLF